MGQKELNQYIREIRREPFRWGHHDCLTFSNTAFKICYGFGYADDWLGGYMDGDDPILPSKMRKKFGADSFDEAVGRKLQEVSHVPPRGALVATKKVERWLIGYGLGICVGTKAAFLSRGGVVYSSLDDIDKAWMPK